MKIHNLSKGLALIGIIGILLSMLWFKEHPDLSQELIYIGMGVFILIFAHIYEWIRIIQNNLESKRLEILELQRVITEHEKILSE